MHTEKISISLPASLIYFMGNYQEANSCRSRSEVIQTALKLLQQRELEKCYRESVTEIDPIFEIISADGLDDETW